MKTFEKFWKKVGDEYIDEFDKLLAKCVWRAALKEVLSHPGWGVDEESVHNSIVEELNNE